jgi:hypothetical protein
MKKISIAVVILSLTFALSACDDGGKAGPKLAIEDVEREYHNLFCEKIESCEFGAYFSIVINDRQGCLDFLASLQEREIGIGDLVDAVNEGRIEYDAGKAHACIEAMRAMSCPEFGEKEPEVCLGVFSGTVADGGACTLGEECVSGYCNKAACPGTCEPAVAVGGACEDTVECTDGTKCVLDECTAFSAPVAAGGACDPDEDWCDLGLFCHPTTGECTARVEVGESCEEVAELECEQGALCIGMGEEPKTCVTLTVRENTDDTCDYGAGTLCAYYNDLVCAIDDFQTFTGTCQAPSRLNDVCFDSTNLVLTPCDMFGDLYCDMSGGFQTDGACAAKKAGGAACEDSDHCLSGFCDNDVCADEEDLCR